MYGSFERAITPTLSYDGGATRIVRADDGSIMRRMWPVRGKATMVMSDQQARLNGCKRGRRPLERPVVGCARRGTRRDRWGKSRFG